MREKEEARRHRRGGKTEKKNKEKSFLVFSYTAIRRLIYRVFLLILSKGISGGRHIVFFFLFFNSLILKFV